MKLNKQKGDMVRNKHSKTRQSFPSISCGKREKQILRYLLDNDDEWFNIRKYSKVKGIPRSSIYDILNRLISKRMINKVRQVTTKGKRYLGMSESVQKPDRRECRKEKLSTHYLKYNLKIKDKNEYSYEKLRQLQPERTKQNILRNFTEDYAYFEDSTIVIKLNSIIIHIHDIITNNVEEAHFIAFQRAIALTVSLSKIGLKTERMTLSQAHYARVESYLSEKLHKIDNKYFLDLGNGEKFWIDMSDKREDETDSAPYRDRVDELFLDLKNSKSVMSDVDKAKDDLDKMKDISLNQIKAIQAFISLEQVKIGMNLEDNIPKEIKDKKLNNYFG